MVKKRAIAILGLVCLAGLSTAARADDGSLLRVGGDVGVAFGGNSLLTPDVTGSSPKLSTGQSLPAGNATYFDIHLRQGLGDTGLGLQEAVGYSFACDWPICIPRDDAKSWDYTFQRVTVDLLAQYHWGVNRISLGRTFHYYNRLDSTDFTYPFGTVYLAPARGWTFMYQYGPLGIRYTNIIYRNKNSANATNGSNIGIFISLDPDDWKQ